MGFKAIEAADLKENPFEMIGNKWMLITAGNEEKVNTMTASWGGLGVIWGKPTATCYIRRSRYTKEFVDREEYFTLSVFGEDKRPALALCGRVSGRDTDKIKESGLTVMKAGESYAFEEAETILVCRKVYAQEMGKENFVDRNLISKWYADQDWHTMYLGEIVEILVKED